MEGKTRVIVSVLLVSLVLGQIQVDAKSCCPSTTARNIYNTCRFAGGSRQVCASLSGCKIISGNTCPDGYKHDILKNNNGGTDAVNEFCKLGCTSSVCDPLTTLQDSSDASEVVNEAVEKCSKACFAICTKGRSIIATPVDIA